MRPESPTKKQKRFLATPVFIDPEDLIQIINTKTNLQDYAIIDVRTDDFQGGNIKGCINIPCSRFEYDMETIYDQLKHIPQLYFHCQLSQVRGPASAQKYLRFLNQSDQHHSQEIFIVRGGYSQFEAVAGRPFLENVSYGY
jgi:rhodanese-related sulfurtransferase